jgi:predicted glycogen debranching enzyme
VPPDGIIFAVRLSRYPAMPTPSTSSGRPDRSEANDVVRQIPLSGADWNARASREWLVTNGLGGYASGTLAGPPTRRYHAWLVAALPAPLGRMVLVTRLDERVRFAGQRTEWLSRYGDDASSPLSEFSLVAGLPHWRYQLDGLTIERRLFMPHHQNTVIVTYTVTRAGGPVRLGFRPLLHARQHEAPVDTPLPAEPMIVAHPRYLEVTFDPAVPPLRLAVRNRPATFTFEPQVTDDVKYGIEEERGYASRGPAWSPGYYKLDLTEGDHVMFVASTEPVADLEALTPEDAWTTELERRTRLLVTAGNPPPSSQVAELVLAADQFIIQPASRAADSTRARAAGEDARSIIAGYHWFTDWGRDTMISLEGLTLSTGRIGEARGTLLTFAHYLRDGLLPNLFPEGAEDGLYHTADATLWFFHAIDRYVTVSDDADTIRTLLPSLDEVVRFHVNGTRFGIRMDSDGLLTQGDPRLPLTWMDAKVGDWIVTPRRGKTVEINALWFNAVQLLASWHRQFDQARDDLDEIARRARTSFNRRFWFDDGGYLYDIVDGEAGDDSSCRPNQIFSLALRYPVLDEARWASVVDTVSARLLTRYGLRTLDPGHPDFKSQYFGDLRTRDAAYHQGTVWAWLMGPFINAWLRVHPDKNEDALKLLSGFGTHLSEHCVGSISEIFDALEPHTPRGCVAQAWSVAEVLRCLKQLEPVPAKAGQAPGGLVAATER